MSDLKMNPLGGGDQANQPTNKSVRMHVMPDNVLNQEELYQKVSKAGQVKEIKETPGKPLTPPSVAPPPMPPASVLARPSAPAKSGSGKTIILVVVIMLILGAGAFGAWYWWSSNSEQSADLTELQRIEEEQRLAEELRLAEEQKAAEEAKKLAEENRQKEERDRQRLSDVKDRQDALLLYFEKHQKYPETLPENGIWQEGDDVFAAELKADPLSDSDYKYVYNRLAESSYTLTVRLEIGFNQIKAGINIFTERQKVNLNGTVEVVAPPTEPEPVTLSMALDTDNDGLTDVEELLFKSDLNLVDTDDDTYEDSLEIKNLYSPSNTAPETLLGVGLVAEFISDLEKYKFLYPVSWKVQKIDIDDSNIIFVSEQTSEYVEFKIEENPGELALNQWVKLKMQNLKLKFKANYFEEAFVNKDKSLTGILLPELFMAFYANGNKVYSFTYQFDPEKPLSYSTTFLMFVKSFHLLIEEEPAPTEEVSAEESETGEETGTSTGEASVEDSNAPSEAEFDDLLNAFFEESEDETSDAVPEASGEFETEDEPVDTSVL
jgi:flagellar basal body-associated protein FliL